MKTGLSLYFGTDSKENDRIIEKAKEVGMTYAFTSLHIPEENVEDYRQRVRDLLARCQEAGLNLMVDISPHTLEKLNCSSYIELADLGFDYIRLDFGFTNEEVVELSKTFHLVFNASTLTDADLFEWKALGADLSRFTACHNFYPKPLTGLSLNRVKDVNKKLKAHGFMTMSFVAGDKDFRGPLFQGLPTVEAHRQGDVFLNMLELFYETHSDVVLIGDVDVSEKVWQQIQDFNNGFVTLKTTIKEAYAFIKETVHHDRPDSSDYIIRSQESRQYNRPIPAEYGDARKQGAICISNEHYLRYEGELEIARVDLEPDEKVNVIGYVQEEHIPYVTYIKDGLGFKLT